MPTTTTGIFFLSRQRPRMERQPDGSRRLVLRVVDRQGAHRTEAYEVAWPGDAAEQWWAQHNGIQPGQPLRLVLINPRSIAVPSGQPETHATVQSCELAPPAPSWQAHEQRIAASHTT